MGTGEASPADDADLTLLTPRPRAGHSAASAGVLLGMVAGVGWGLWRLTSAPVYIKWAGWIFLGVAGLVLLRALGIHTRQLGYWLRWRRRPLPAMRLTAAGLDYSPGYTGEFELHVPWVVPMTSAYRQGPDNIGFFWCLYAPMIEGLGSLPPSISRQWPLDESRLRSEWREFVRTFRVGVRSPAQAAANHLVMYGTPIVINPYLMSSDSIDAFDQRLRERTDGRCTLQPPQHRIGPTTRPNLW